MEKENNTFNYLKTKSKCYHIHYVIQDMEYSELITLGVITFGVALNV